MPVQLLIAVSAGVGGVAPSLVHLAQGFLKPIPEVPGPFYFVGVGIFFLLGALVAFSFAETNARKAFFLGIGLPALVATAQTQGIPKNIALSLIPSAYAQISDASPPNTRFSSITFKPAVECKGCELWFTDSDGKVIAKEILGATPTPRQVIVPKEATAFGVADPKSNFRLVPVPKDSPGEIAVEFDRKYSPLKDLRRGLGDYDLKAYDPNVKWSVK